MAVSPLSYPDTIQPQLKPHSAAPSSVAFANCSLASGRLQARTPFAFAPVQSQSGLDGQTACLIAMLSRLHCSPGPYCVLRLPCRARARLLRDGPAALEQEDWRSESESNAVSYVVAK